MTEYKIYMNRFFTRTKCVADAQGNLLYKIKRKSTFSRKHMENHPAGEIIWQQKSGWDFFNEVDQFMVSVERKSRLGGDDFKFEYGGVLYKWSPKNRFSKSKYLCVNCNNDQQVAVFQYKYMSRTFGFLTIHTMSQWPARLTELLIFTVMRIVEVQRDEDAAEAA
ncbi:hypothetical protein IWQ62_001420 [Dispira parvispora]|uniref:Uncharacterized protein n=1 Tax=Dispira parvispora TaxID=1520584 RepID=A0A9W8E3W0_9FUNG|nr:hypothetical protein IWQ62_001420 [Dispira parvispora]